MLDSGPAAATVDEARPFPAGSARQALLFDARPKIIPFETIAVRKGGTRLQPQRRKSRPGGQATAATAGNQPPLDLRAPAPRERSAVNDDAPVAPAAVRLHAATLDAIFLATGIVAAAVPFYLMGGRFVPSAKAVLPYAATIAALGFFYHLFWCVLGRESAGMRCLGLRVLTFDGHLPTWQQRVGRLVLTCLDVTAAGLGLVWALIDEEGLTWHDHLSKTFPAEYDPNPGTLRRR